MEIRLNKAKPGEAGTDGEGTVSSHMTLFNCLPKASENTMFKQSVLGHL